MKSLIEFINESASLGKQLEDELNKEVGKMKLTTNDHGDCLRYRFGCIYYKYSFKFTH